MSRTRKSSLESKNRGKKVVLRKQKQKAKARAPRDTGVVTLPNGYPISEETRDALAKHDWASGPRRKEEDNPDQWSTADWERNQASGFRANQLSQQMELWMLGRKVDSIPLSMATPNALASMHERAFATIGSLLETTPISPIPGRIQ